MFSSQVRKRISIFFFLITFNLGCSQIKGEIGAVGVKLGLKKNPLVLMETSKGKIKIELFKYKAPESVKNFLFYASEGFYDGLIFHRVIANFMIQGGGFDSKMNQKETNAPIKNEAANGLLNTRGTLAMARTDVIDSATSQFFINVVNNHSLNHKKGSSEVGGYAVFGKVIEGMDVVDIIRHVKTSSFRGFRNVPLEPVIIKSVTLLPPEK